MVTLTGKVVKHHAIAGNGKKILNYDLILNKKIKCKCSIWEKKSSEKRIMIQCAYLKANMSKYVGKKGEAIATVDGKVTVKGEFMGAASGYYCERYAIMASSIKKYKKK